MCGGGSSDVAERGGDSKFAKIEAKGWEVDKVKAVGEGGFGSVHLCRNANTQKQRAC